MKRTVTKLRVGRETLRALDQGLELAIGGLTASANVSACPPCGSYIPTGNCDTKPSALCTA